MSIDSKVTNCSNHRLRHQAFLRPADISFRNTTAKLIIDQSRPLAVLSISRVTRHLSIYRASPSLSFSLQVPSIVASWKFRTNRSTFTFSRCDQLCENLLFYVFRDEFSKEGGESFLWNFRFFEEGKGERIILRRIIERKETTWNNERGESLFVRF